jgi:hypothetical protein
MMMAAFSAPESTRCLVVPGADKPERSEAIVSEMRAMAS